MLLDKDWRLSAVAQDLLPNPLSLDLPNDVHSVLLAQGVIPNPYWRDNEPKLDWVHENEWLLEKSFSLESLEAAHYSLSITGLDCVAEIFLNEQSLGRCENQFMRHDFDVTPHLKIGQNHLKIHFFSNSQTAKAKHDAFPFEVPYLKANSRLAHYNFLRKTQCHAGWDWNIALSPLGVYGVVELREHHQTRLDEVSFRQEHDLAQQTVRLTAKVFFQAWSVCEVTAKLEIAGQRARVTLLAYPGANTVSLNIELENPRLWYPAGYGEAYLYPATLQLDDETRSFQIGLRQIELITDKDTIGQRFAFRVNGQELFMRGANWIPADALPARIKFEVVRDLLQSARDANMNMLRVWGGGQYEPDYFYQLCSELGILVWQDFMFACNLYPAADKAWLQNVRIEAEQQIRRLSQHACLALWCGDNELVGALNWFEESRKDRDRYLAMYDRLNHSLEQAIDAEQTDTAFWPSSPSVGRLNFGDGWHDDKSGDMHFWDVWHSAKDFEHYRTVIPRFCSEFGFQSFPSMRVIESFTEPADRNISSGVMDIHQRNQGGNGRIVETLARYFRFPNSFEQMVYLSQVSQGLAMKTAIEYWRAHKPRCMGTLYWQLNDTWPVASWASLEYGGGWKLTHYLARRFFAPVLVTAQPHQDQTAIDILVVNDLPQALELQIELWSVSVEGAMNLLFSEHHTCPTDRAICLHTIASAAIADNAFLFLRWQDATGAIQGENEYLPKRPKDYSFRPATIQMQTSYMDGEPCFTFSTDYPVLYVTYDHGADAVYSDNCFTLLPQFPKQLQVLRKRPTPLPPSPASVWSLGGQTLYDNNHSGVSNESC